LLLTNNEANTHRLNQSISPVRAWGIAEGKTKLKHSVARKYEARERSGAIGFEIHPDSWDALKNLSPSNRPPPQIDKENMYGAAAHRSPEHTPTSPSRHRGQSGYSPQNFNAPTIPPHYRGQPTSPSVTSLPPLNGFGAFSQKRSSSTFYDPTSETIERKVSWNVSTHLTRSPILVSFGHCR